MKKPLILLLAIVAVPAIASNYRTGAHAWYNDNGDIEISSKLMHTRYVTPLPQPSKLLPPATRTLPAAQLFHINSAKLLSPSASLQTLARNLHNSQTAKTIEITGYTDNTGSSAYNLKLSEQRAQSIQRYLAEFAPQHRYIVRGQGEANPIASNKTRSGREQNRRVTVTISGGAG
jgi:outer membrane protein OmpA-like peptidoglycan-associated protein